VGVIGTGGSAIQLVPQIAPKVAHLALFQRTPPWILPRRDVPIPAWRQRAYARLPALQKMSRAWTYGLLESRAVAFTRFPSFLRLASRWARVHLESQVNDAALRKALMPDYTMGCKRILLSDDYYPSLQLPQVALHTTRIERVEPDGVRLVDGRRIPLDILVHGTGFQTQRPVPAGLLSGLGGRDLADTWGGEAQAYLGTTVHGFPNLFLLVGPNTGLGHSSMVYMIESQVAYVKSALEVMDTLGISACHPRKEVQDAWNLDLQRRSADTVWMTGGCRSWYLSPNGHNTTLWPGFTFGFRYATRRFDPRVVEIL
jgi:cation diffusion facilitator CzcD-associated flavoprotein CzcO